MPPAVCLFAVEALLMPPFVFVAELPMIILVVPVIVEMPEVVAVIV